MNKLKFSPIYKNDIDEIVLAFKKIGWDKPKSIYENYLAEQSTGHRLVIIAKINEIFCGYVTLKWHSDYSHFKTENIPEIVDLNVLPDFRNQGIGTALIQNCEKLVKKQGHNKIGLGAGLTADYGAAQHLYFYLGYIPDGNGLHYKNKPLTYGQSTIVDDDLVLYFTKIIA